MNRRYRRKDVALRAAAAVLLLGAGLRAGGALAQAPAGDAERGEQLYHDHGCYGCHGFSGQTGARDLVGTNSPIVAEFETFLTYLRLRADTAPLLPSTRMPNYPEGALADDDARDIFAFIRSFELDAPPVESVPTLEAILESAER